MPSAPYVHKPQSGAGRVWVLLQEASRGAFRKPSVGYHEGHDLRRARGHVPRRRQGCAYAGGLKEGKASSCSRSFLFTDEYVTGCPT